VWQKYWIGETNDKLHRLQPTIDNYRHGEQTRKDEVVIRPLCVGQSLQPHSYILKKEQPPVCQLCNAPLTVEHMLIACSKSISQRQKYFPNCICLKDFFNLFSTNVLIDLIKETSIYRDRKL
jgi:hypothetical protein